MSTAIASGNAMMKRLPWLSSRVATDLAGPVLVVLILAMLILPLPPLLLDLFFTFNIAIAMLVLLASMHVEKPLEFSVFPTALLLTTPSFRQAIANVESRATACCSSANAFG